MPKKASSSSGGEARIPDTLTGLAVHVDEIKPSPGNPRRGDVDAIADSLTRNGQYRPVVVNRRTTEILAGNHTYAAARKLGWTHIAATFVDVDADQAARIILADNRTADLGGYDNDALAAMLDSVSTIEGTGYTAADLDRILGAGEPLESADLYTDDPDGYAEQYGVIVVCGSEAEQEATYKKLAAEYPTVKVVTT